MHRHYFIVSSIFLRSNYQYLSISFFFLECKQINNNNNNSDDDNDNNGNDDYVTASSDSRYRRSRRNSVTDEESVSAMNRIADALCREESNVVLPAPPTSDEVDAMLHTAGLQLRQIPYARRMETLLEIVKMVHTRLMNEEMQ